MAIENLLVLQKPIALPETRARVNTDWGWFAPITLLQSVALLLMAFAYTANRNGSTWATALFWISLIAIFAPTAYRVLLPNIARKERIGLVVGIGLALYLVKILYSPLDFSFHDEFLHWRTAADIFTTGRLFTPNPILTVSPLYPGLEVVTTAFANFSGLTVVESGMIILGVVRLMFMLVLYLFYEQVSRSSRVGAIAALLYLGNSNFLYFDAQFSYESLSLPLATAVLYIVLLQQRAQGRGFVRLVLLVLPIVVTIAITHHLTAYVTAAVLLIWAVVAVVVRRTRRQSLNIGFVALLTLGIVSAWTVFTGNVAEDYLVPVIGGGIAEFVRLILNEESGRQLFHGAAGLVTPLWERILGILSIICIMLVLPFGFLEIWRSPFKTTSLTDGVKIYKARVLRAWYRYRNDPVAVMFAGLIVLYPVMLAFRFTTSGWEIANRSSEFSYWGLGFILAIGALRLQTLPILSRMFTLAFVVWATVIFLGGSVAGWPAWMRLPGQYMVSADARSIEPLGVADARWAGTYLNSQDRISADRINTLLLATYGHMLPVTHQYDNLYLLSVFFSEKIGPVERDLMQQVNLRYLLVDDRLSTQLPAVGVYFEGGEPNADQHITPPSLTALTKFDTLPGVSKIFDSGHIKIYDVSVYSHDLP